MFLESIRCPKNGRQISDKRSEKYICTFHWYVRERIHYLHSWKDWFLLSSLSSYYMYQWLPKFVIILRGHCWLFFQRRNVEKYYPITFVPVLLAGHYINIIHFLAFLILCIVLTTFYRIAHSTLIHFTLNNI